MDLDELARHLTDDSLINAEFCAELISARIKDIELQKKRLLDAHDGSLPKEEQLKLVSCLRYSYFDVLRYTRFLMMPDDGLKMNEEVAELRGDILYKIAVLDSLSE